MPRRVPSYRRFKPKNLGLVVIDGKQHYLGKYGTPESLAEYNRLIQERLNRPAGPSLPTSGPRAGLSVSKLILAYWEHADRHYRRADGTPSGELENMRVALSPPRRLHGATSAIEFGPLALRQVRDELIRSGLSRSTVNARVNRIRRVFRWGASHELIPASNYQALMAVEGLKRGRSDARETEPIQPVPLENVEIILPYLSAPVRAVVRLQLLTACRTGEVLIMRGADLKEGNPNWEYRPSNHKNAWRGQQRIIPLGPKAQEVVRPFMRDDPEDYLFSPRQSVAELHRLRGDLRKSKRTPSEATKRSTNPGEKHRRCYDRRSYRQAIVRACRKAGIPEWSPLQLRHTAATQIRSQYGLEAAQIVLGHARADVTQVYAERDLAKAHAVMAEFG